MCNVNYTRFIDDVLGNTGFCEINDILIKRIFFEGKTRHAVIYKAVNQNKEENYFNTIEDLVIFYDENL